MDLGTEGVNTYINAFANELRVPGSSAWGAYMTLWRQAVERGIQAPLMAAPDHIEGAALGAIGYRKPGAVLLTLRDNVVVRDPVTPRSRVRALVGVRASDAGGFLPDDGDRVRAGSLVVLAGGSSTRTDVLDIGIDSVNNDAPQVSHGTGDGAMGGAPGPVVRTADSTQAPAASGGLAGRPRTRGSGRR